MGCELEEWAPRLEALLASGRVTLINRVMVLAETASTQDAARRTANGNPGVLVVAGRQFGGRGRLGRVWADTSTMGVAATFAIEAGRMDDGWLALAAGVAALWACEELGARGAVGVRWPNDVVELGGSGRKVAGVLIERTGATALVGIGINVAHREGDWPLALERTAVSLVQLGVRASRLDVLERLVLALDRALKADEEELGAAWRSAETLLGSKREFLWNGRSYAGVVAGIDPLHAIRLSLADGSEQVLPALSTSMVHPVPGPEGR